MTQKSLGAWKFVLDMGSSSHWGVSLSARSVPGQEADGVNLGIPFRSSRNEFYVECTHENRLDDSLEYTQHTYS